MLISFPNNISTSALPNPDLMNPTSIHIKTVTDNKGLLCRIFVLGVGDGQIPLENEVGGQAAVGMGAIMCMPVRVVVLVYWLSLTPGVLEAGPDKMEGIPA